MDGGDAADRDTVGSCVEEEDVEEHDAVGGKAPLHRLLRLWYFKPLELWKSRKDKSIETVTWSTYELSFNNTILVLPLLYGNIQGDPCNSDECFL